MWSLNRVPRSLEGVLQPEMIHSPWADADTWIKGWIHPCSAWNPRIQQFLCVEFDPNSLTSYTSGFSVSMVNNLHSIQLNRGRLPASLFKPLSTATIGCGNKLTPPFNTSFCLWDSRFLSLCDNFSRAIPCLTAIIRGSFWMKHIRCQPESCECELT